MRKDNLKVVKKIWTVVLLILLLIIFFSLLILTRDNQLIKNVKEFIQNDTKILYITDKQNYSKYPIDLFEKYDIEYLYINSDNLSAIEKSKLEKIINSKYLSNIIVVFDNGKLKDAIIEFENEDHLNNFLIKHEIIPEIIGDNSSIISDVNKLLDTEFSLIYFPYEQSDTVDYQNTILKEISSEYNINYKKINAYLLSKTQKNKLNSILKISSVEDQIVILVKDRKIIGSIRGVNNKKNYLNKLDSFKFIDSIDSYITYISYAEFKNILNKDDKSIMVIGKEDCKYCDEVLKELNDIAINYDININYINVGKMDSDISLDVEKTLSNLEYNDGFTTPLTIIVEKNKLLDYIIGSANEEYFVDIFTENGIIK